MSKRSLAIKSDLKAGKTVWVVYFGEVYKVTIHSRLKRDWTDSFYTVFETKGYYRDYLSAGDAGVKGHAYDNRPCQVFLNKRSAEYWAKKWEGLNPNFIDKDTGEYCEPEFYDYDWSY